MIDPLEIADQLTKIITLLETAVYRMIELQAVLRKNPIEFEDGACPHCGKKLDGTKDAS